MKILEKIKSRKLKKTLAAVLAGGMLMFGAGNLAEADSNAEFEFRQAYLSAPLENRAFHQTIVFFGTTFHVDISSEAQILRDATMRMTGNMNWEYTNPKTNVTTNNTMPFYLTQSGDEMTLYVQRQNRWNRFLMPGLPVGLANSLKSNDLATLQENMRAVKDVSIFRETNAQQIFNITLDGQYLSELMNSYGRKQNTAQLSAEEVAEQTKFFHNLSAALAKTDVLCTWTFDKINDRTMTVVIDFTDLMRAYAQNILDESAEGKIVISDEERLLMETIGYYSEFHYSWTYSAPEQKFDFNPPSAARRAAVNNNIFQDFFKAMATR